ncbi:MAG: radical SAM family heme chaperone HemW, partial [Myxococcales bacterium]
MGGTTERRSESFERNPVDARFVKVPPSIHTGNCLAPLRPGACYPEHDRGVRPCVAHHAPLATPRSIRATGGHCRASPGSWPRRGSSRRSVGPGGPRVVEPRALRPLLVYVHFPWCLEKCPYCDFVSYRTTREAIDQRGYTDAVLSELRARLAGLRASGESWSLASVFIGGGTPSLWEPDQLGRLLAELRAELPAVGEVEVTAECNPSSLDRERAEGLARAGVNRLSIGVQSLDADRLKFLGRLHDGPGALRAVRDALDAGFARVSADLIYAVASQRPEEAVAEAAQLLDLGLTHLSAYSLTIEAGTRFGELARRGRLPLADDGATIETFFALHESLGQRGLGHYEVSNYAAPGQESQHNLGYWQGQLYLGLGCAAVGATPAPDGQVVRYRNQPVPEQYVAAVARAAPLFEAGGLPDSAESLDPEMRLRERIMLGLRLASGFDLEEAAASLGVD